MVINNTFPLFTFSFCKSKTIFTVFVAFNTILIVKIINLFSFANVPIFSIRVNTKFFAYITCFYILTLIQDFLKLMAILY